jgi:hypothetical protein
MTQTQEYELHLSMTEKQMLETTAKFQAFILQEFGEYTYGDLLMCLATLTGSAIKCSTLEPENRASALAIHNIIAEGTWDEAAPTLEAALANLQEPSHD